MPCRAMVIIKIVGSVVFFKIHNRNFRSRLEKPFYIPHRLAFVKFILDVGEHWEKWTQIAQVILSIACGQMPATIPAFQGIIVSSVHPNKSLTIHLQMKEPSHLAAFATGLYIYIYNINWLMACTRVISHLPPASGAGGVSEARQGCRPKFGGAAPSQRGGASGRGATIHGGSEELMMD